MTESSLGVRVDWGPTPIFSVVTIVIVTAAEYSTPARKVAKKPPHCSGAIIILAGRSHISDQNAKFWVISN